MPSQFDVTIVTSNWLGVVGETGRVIRRDFAGGAHYTVRQEPDASVCVGLCGANEVPASAFSTTAVDRTSVEARFAGLMHEFERTVVNFPNPHPVERPTMKLVQQGARPLLRTSFPNAPDFTCDSWMYESEMEGLPLPRGGGAYSCFERSP